MPSVSFQNFYVVSHCWMIVTCSNPSTAMKFSVPQYGNQGYRIAQLNRRQRCDHDYMVNTKVFLQLAELCWFFSSPLEGTQSIPNQAMGIFLDNGELVQKLYVSWRSKVWIQLINLVAKRPWLQIGKVNNQGNPVFMHCQKQQSCFCCVFRKSFQLRTWWLISIPSYRRLLTTAE